MRYYQENWLPHLKDSIPIKGRANNLSMYTITLEAWRRGLIVKFRHTYSQSEKRNRIVYSISHKGKTHEFNVSRGDIVSKEAIRNCIKKDKTKEFLLNSNVPTPLGKSFDENVADEEIINYASSLGFPVVVKPVDGLSGKGVLVNLKNEKEVKESLYRLRIQLNYKYIIVEQYVKGEDCRVYVINNKVIAAANRIPANVIGDGKNSIKKLIECKNQARDTNPNYYKRYISYDKELYQNIEEKGYSLESILGKDEILYLRSTSNISQGAEAIDVTEDLTEEIKNIAISAAKSISGLKQCSVDMLIDFTNNKAYVIEINSRPQIGLHLFPSRGMARDVPKAIVDYYFPESKEIMKNELFYFDFNSYMELLEQGATKELLVKKIRSYKPITKKYEITTDESINKVIRNLAGYAEILRLDGFIRREKNFLTLIIGGSSSTLEEMEKVLNTHENILNLTILEWDFPLIMGFKTFP